MEPRLEIADIRRTNDSGNDRGPHEIFPGFTIFGLPPRLTMFGHTTYNDPPMTPRSSRPSVSTFTVVQTPAWSQPGTVLHYDIPGVRFVEVPRPSFIWMYLVSNKDNMFV